MAQRGMEEGMEHFCTSGEIWSWGLRCLDIVLKCSLKAVYINVISTKGLPFFTKLFTGARGVG